MYDITFRTDFARKISSNENKDCDSIEENLYNGDTSLSETEVHYTDSSTIESETECESIETNIPVIFGSRLRPRKRTKYSIRTPMPSMLFTENSSCLSGFKGCSRCGKYKNKRRKPSGIHVSYKKAMQGKILFPILRRKINNSSNNSEKNTISGRRRSRKNKAKPRRGNVSEINATMCISYKNAFCANTSSLQSRLPGSSRIANKASQMRARYQRMDLKKLGLRYKRKAMLCKIVLPILTVKKRYIHGSPKRGRRNSPSTSSRQNKRRKEKKKRGRPKKTPHSPPISSEQDEGAEKKTKRSRWRHMGSSLSLSLERSETVKRTNNRGRRGKRRIRNNSPTKPIVQNKDKRDEQKSRVIKSSLLRYELYRHQSIDPNTSEKKLSIDYDHTNNSQISTGERTGRSSTNSYEEPSTNRTKNHTNLLCSSADDTTHNAQIKMSQKEKKNEHNSAERADENSDTVTECSISDEDTSVIDNSDDTHVTSDTLSISTQGTKDTTENNDLHLQNNQLTVDTRQESSDSENTNVFSDDAVMFGKDSNYT